MANFETNAEFIERNGYSEIELSKEDRIDVLKEKEVVLDTIEVGGEKFIRVSYMFADSLYSHVQGQFSDRFREALRRREPNEEVRVLDYHG